MKLRALLILSVALNVYFAFNAFSRRPVPQSAATDPSKPTPTVRAYTARQTNTASPQFNWEAVEADDYQVYIANLRAIGCPEETIQDIVVADVFKLFEDKKWKLRAARPKIEYWKTSDSPASYLLNYRVLSEALQSRVFEADRKLTQPIDAERDSLLRSLGINPNAQKLPSSAIDPRVLLLDFISESKRREIAAIYEQLARDWEAARTDIRREDIAYKGDAHQQEIERRVKALLTPEEALQYDLRMSSTADKLRSQLVGFDPTESEFIEIYKIRKAHDEARDEKITANRGDTPELRQAYKDGLDLAIKNLLGEERYADYDRATDFGFQQILVVTQKTGLPTSTAIAAFKIERAAMGRAYELRQSNMDKDQLNATLDSLRTEIEASLASILGAEAWQEHSKGFTFHNALNAISPRN
jgi:hypothetical protein